MDEDQSARRNAQKYLKVIDPDYYELEGRTYNLLFGIVCRHVSNIVLATYFQFSAHVFFDDAWTDDAQLGRVPNDFVRQFFGVVSTAVRSVYLLCHVYERFKIWRAQIFLKQKAIRRYLITVKLMV